MLQAVIDWFPGKSRKQQRPFARVLGRSTLRRRRAQRRPPPHRRGNFAGSNPCARGLVPGRDPQTAADLGGYQKRFTDLPRETLPPWAPAARFDHFYRLAVNTRVAPTETGKPLPLGDPLMLT